MRIEHLFLLSQLKINPIDLFFLLQVSGLETNLSFMTEKVHILQKNYVEMHDLALQEIDKLKSRIEELKSRQHGKYK